MSPEGSGAGRRSDNTRAAPAEARRGRAARFRTTGTFVGGEDPDSFGRVTGTDFYRTISDMPAVARLSRREEAGAFDVFTAGRRFVAVLTKAVGALHNGILPSYMVWCLLGMVVMFVAFLCS